MRGTTKRSTRSDPTPPGPLPDASGASAPVRSLTAVGVAAGLYGLLVLLTVVYEWSLGSLPFPAGH